MLGVGTIYRVETSVGSGVYQALAKVTGITPPSVSPDVNETTTMDSVDQTKEFEPGMIDPGECSGTMHFDPSSTTDTFMNAWSSTPDVRSQQIEWPNGVIWTFDGFPTNYAPNEVTPGEIATAAFSIKVTSSKEIS